MSTQAHTESHDDHDAHHAKLYAAVLMALLFLTGITVGASYIDLGPLNIVVALLIATTKASLVGLFFMHLLYDKPVNGMVLVAGFMFLGLLLSFCLLDIDNRPRFAPTNKSVPKASGIMPPEPAAPGAAPKPAGEGAAAPAEHK
jgi:cytochrome c oxidase subunit 4